MMNFMSKLTPRAIGSGIKKRVSGLAIPTRNGSPYTRVINGLTKINKVAKETRFKKRKSCGFSATALLIVSQTGINVLHQAVNQEFKPVIHRRVNMLPLEPGTVMGIDEMRVQQEEHVEEMPIQQEEHVDETPTQQEEHIDETPAQQEEHIDEISTQQEQVSAQREELKRPCIPALIMTGRNGTVKDIDQIPLSRIITQNLYAWRQFSKWEKGTQMHPRCLSQLQMAEIERKKRVRKEEEEEEEDERQRLENRKPKPGQPEGLYIKRSHAEWKVKEWRKKEWIPGTLTCY